LRFPKINFSLSRNKTIENLNGLILARLKIRFFAKQPFSKVLSGLIFANFEKPVT